MFCFGGNVGTSPPHVCALGCAPVLALWRQPAPLGNGGGSNGHTKTLKIRIWGWRPSVRQMPIRPPFVQQGGGGAIGLGRPVATTLVEDCGDGGGGRGPLFTTKACLTLGSRSPDITQIMGPRSPEGGIASFASSRYAGWTGLRPIISTISAICSAARH